MTDPLDTRARDAADGLQEATAAVAAPPVSAIRRRARVDRLVGAGFVVALLTAFAVFGALANLGGDRGREAAQVGTSTTTSPSTTAPATTAPPSATTTSILGGLDSVWQGPGALTIEIVGADQSRTLAVANLVGGEYLHIHLQDEAEEMTMDMRLRGTAQPGSSVVVQGMEVPTTEGSWTADVEIELSVAEPALIVLEVDDIAYAIEVFLSHTLPGESLEAPTTTTLADLAGCAPATTLPPGDTGEGSQPSTTTVVPGAPPCDPGGPVTTVAPTTTAPALEGTTTTVTSLFSTTTTTLD